jgi:hypothetical protein
MCCTACFALLSIAKELMVLLVLLLSGVYRHLPLTKKRIKV